KTASTMLDFEVHARGRKCAKTDRPFEPGEEYFSVLLAEGANVVRYDYGADAWDGPPETSIGWWKSVVPDHSNRKLHWAPNDVMLHYFEQIENQPEKEDVRYVLALLMLRRRVLRLEEEERPGEPQMTLYCPKNENTYHVRTAPPDDARIEAIQEELAELLFGK
ncbi:MAG: hypothetical protein KDA41_03070, partial [Planctomycetales bacterium]|nr:hypothetical protein [Planctomycetales bacterium]